MTDPAPVVHPSEQLRVFTESVFRSHGVPDEDARQAADVLALSDLRGIDSHGVARLKTYHDLLSIGRLNPRPRMEIIRETVSTATIDGDNGLGLVVGPYANRVAMEKAEQAGTGWVAVRNSNHYGICGYYTLAAVARGMIGWTFTNTTPMTVPMGGRQRRLGTNPISVAFPAGEEAPVVVDLATSTAAFGKIEIAMRADKPIPTGWALDRDGEPTTDPFDLPKGGALLPLGSDFEHSGHKGYALSAMVDLLSGPLSGANWGPFTPTFALRYEDPEKWVGKGIGHLFGAMRVDAFIDVAEHRKQMDHWIRTFRATMPAPGESEVLVPGDPERIAHEHRAVHGIPVSAAVLADLEQVSRETGVTL